MRLHLPAVLPPPAAGLRGMECSVARCPGGGSQQKLHLVSTLTAFHCLAVGMTAQVPCPDSVSLRMFTLLLDLTNYKVHGVAT